MAIIARPKHERISRAGRRNGALDETLAVATVREAIKRIEADGWYFVRQRGSHRQYQHPTKPGVVTVPGGRPHKDLHPKTYRSILSQAKLEDQ